MKRRGKPRRRPRQQLRSTDVALAVRVETLPAQPSAVTFTAGMSELLLDDIVISVPRAALPVQPESITVDNNFAPFVFPTNNQPYQALLSAGGQSLVYFRLSATANGLRVITDNSTYEYDFAWSADSAWLALSRRSDLNAPISPLVVSVTGGVDQPFPANSLCRDIAWANSVVFCITNNTIRIQAYARNINGEWTLIATSPSFGAAIRHLSAVQASTETRLAYTIDQTDAYGNIREAIQWRSATIAFTNQLPTSVTFHPPAATKPSPVDSAQTAEFPNWSPDGAYLTYKHGDCVGGPSGGGCGFIYYYAALTPDLTGGAGLVPAAHQLQGGIAWGKLVRPPTTSLDFNGSHSYLKALMFWAIYFETSGDRYVSSTGISNPNLPQAAFTAFLSQIPYCSPGTLPGDNAQANEVFVLTPWNWTEG